MPQTRIDYRLLFEGSPDVLLVLLPDAPRYTIVGATRSRLLATQTTADQFGKGLFEVFPDNPDDPQATGTANLRASLERVLATRAADSMAVQKYDIRGPDGTFRVHYWSPKNIPVLSPSGEMLYILHRVEDVTELVRATELGEELRGRTREMEGEVLKRSQELAAANRELREANAKLGQLDAAKTAFFSNVSHEFRTPLTLILSPVEDALAQPAKSLGGESLETVRRNALRLLRLVNSLLDFARIEAGRLRPSFVPTDLSVLTADIASSFRSLIERAGLRLVVDCPPIPQPAYVDPSQWEKIVLNLISNAFKFTLAGEIFVSLRINDGRFHLTVRDTGGGIPARELPRIFERFHRVEGAKGRSFEGTGIGLSLVQELVKLHGGSITASSVEGQGSTFEVSVPTGRAHLKPGTVIEGPSTPSASSVAPYLLEASQWLGSGGEAWEVPSAPAEAFPVSPGSKRTPAPTRARVLVVDDNADMREYLARLLSTRWDVEAAEDGRVALAKAQTRPPDLVLSDVMMPGLDGFGLLRALRAHPRTSHLPVVLLSARAGEESVLGGLDAGADDYLVKPFAAQELLARVNTHLELARLRREWSGELERANRELETFSYSVSHDLRAPLRAIDGFSKFLLSEYAAALDERGRHCLERVRAGTQRMAQLIDDMLSLSRITRAPLNRQRVDLTELARKILGDLAGRDPGRTSEAVVADDLVAHGDPQLFAILLENLLGNAWKFTSKQPMARIQVDKEEREGEMVFFVRDNGAGFDMEHAKKLFAPFQRLHSEAEFEGTGIGLATVHRVVTRHGGRVWAESSPGRGAAFFFTLGEQS